MPTTTFEPRGPSTPAPPRPAPPSHVTATAAVGPLEVPRPLSRAERSLVLGVTGLALKVGFTALGDALSGRGERRRLMGHTALWVPPLWATGGLLCERLQDALRAHHLGVLARAGAYAAAFLSLEYVTGWALRLATGRCPWDDGRARLGVQGVVRLDDAPYWALAGLVGEHLCALLSRVRLEPRPPGPRLRELFRFGCEAVDPATLAEKQPSCAGTPLPRPGARAGGEDEGLHAEAPRV